MITFHYVFTSFYKLACKRFLLNALIHAIIISLAPRGAGILNPWILSTDADEISTRINHLYGKTGFYANDILATNFTHISQLRSIYKIVWCCKYVENERIDTFVRVCLNTWFIKEPFSNGYQYPYVQAILYQQGKHMSRFHWISQTHVCNIDTECRSCLDMFRIKFGAYKCSNTKQCRVITKTLLF